MLGKIFEIITVGFPFCVFKIITGLYFKQYWLVALGVVDIIFNSFNFFTLLFSRRRILDACFLSFLVFKIKKPKSEDKQNWQDLGNAIDILLSFILVAYVVGGGFIPGFPVLYVNLWNLSVVLNVLGAGSGRIVGSIRNLKH